MTDFYPQQFRLQFPLISRDDRPSTENNDLIPSLVYLDNAATTQKPKQVLESMDRFYTALNANVHRASHQLSTKATLAFEQARNLAQNFIGAKNEKEIVWTSGATESINIITQSLARSTLQPGDEILLSVSEHHANIVPWQIVAQQTGAVIKVLPINTKGYINLDEINKLITDKTKFVACAHVSNVIGKINPIEQLIKKAKSVGAITVIDGAQAVAHIPVNVQSLDCDFYVFSAHKMFGPTGIGVLYGKQALLESMPPYKGGGEMIKTVSLIDGSTFNTLPFKFEAGTPNISGVIGLAESINFLTQLITNKNNDYHAYEQLLLEHCYRALDQIDAVNFVVQGIPDIGVIAFTVTEHHNQDVSSLLDSYGIAVRAGHHCAMPLMTHLGINGCIRVSIAAYNTLDEIDYFITCLTKILDEENIANIGSQQQQKQENEDTVTSINLPPNKAMEEIETLFSHVKGWDGRHREIMLLGKTLPRLDKNLRSENTLISGCESLAWLHASQSMDNVYIFTADSDAKIIRGLLVIVLAAFNNKTAIQIREVNIQEFFDKLGLLQHLSPSRGNGLLAIVDKIKQAVN